MSISETARDRIVGAVFLLALAGILLPMWFDGAGVSELPDVQPQVAPIEGAAPAPMPTQGEAWKFADEMETVAEDGPLGPAVGGERTQVGQPQATGDLASRTESGAERPWAIQVAALSGQDAARQLKEKLIAAGFHAYVTEGTGSDGKATIRVSVGPIIERAEADRIRADLRQKFGYEGMLKKFGL